MVTENCMPAGQLKKLDGFTVPCDTLFDLGDETVAFSDPDAGDWISDVQVDHVHPVFGATLPGSSGVAHGSKVMLTPGEHTFTFTPFDNDNGKGERVH